MSGKAFVTGMALGAFSWFCILGVIWVIAR